MAARVESKTATHGPDPTGRTQTYNAISRPTQAAPRDLHQSQQSQAGCHFHVTRSTTIRGPSQGMEAHPSAPNEPHGQSTHTERSYQHSRLTLHIQAYQSETRAAQWKYTQMQQNQSTTRSQGKPNRTHSFAQQHRNCESAPSQRNRYPQLQYRNTERQVQQSAQGQHIPNEHN